MTCTDAHECTHARTHTHACMHSHPHTHTFMHALSRPHTHACMHSHTHPHTHTHTHTRMHSFSGSLDFLYHCTHVHLPLPVAHVLSHDPSLLPTIVHALCDRDPVVSRHAQSMIHSPLSPLKHSSVTVCVRFTKLLYAKLVHEQYSPPPRKCGFTVTPPGDPLHRSHDLGMKLVSFCCSDFQSSCTKLYKAEVELELF